MVRRHLKPTSADYNHLIKGTIDERDVPAELLPVEPKQRAAFLEREIHPATILEEYNKYTELVARQQAEESAAKAKADYLEANAKELEELFYQLTGLARQPDSAPGWKSRERGPFRAAYHGGVDIEPEGITALLKVLKEIGLPQS